MSDCDLYLNGMPKDCRSRGGILEVYLGVRENKTPLLDETTEDEYDAIAGFNYAEGVTLPDFKRYRVQPFNSSAVTSSTVDVQNSTAVDTTVLTFTNAKLTPQKNREYEELQKNGADGLYKDANQTWWYIGFDEPLYFSDGSQAETGTAREDFNGYTIVLTYHGMPIYVPTSIAEAAITGNVEALKAFVAQAGASSSQATPVAAKTKSSKQ